MPEQLPLQFRPPSSSPAKAASPFTEPTLDFLKGTWHVFYSTLPMWESNRNVTITYSPLPDIEGGWNNLVKYQPVSSDKWKTVEGIEKPDPSIPSAWNWRGKGWLKIASSHWETLGWGDEEDGWLVIWFQKTLFTPAGIDVLARRKEGLSEELLNRIRGEMKKVEDQAFNEQAEKIFKIRHD